MPFVPYGKKSKRTLWRAAKPEAKAVVGAEAISHPPVPEATPLKDVATRGYLASRQNTLHGIVPEDEPERWLRCIADHFGAAWLSADGTNPLQVLWKRRDALATNELFTLGHALCRLGAHPKWLAGQVRLAKGKDSNNTAGAFFEMLSLGQIGGAKADMMPAKSSQAGFDGTLCFRPSGRISFSLKRYGMSQHEIDFNRRAESVRSEMCTRLRGETNAIGVLAWAERFPTHEDWNALRGAIQDGTSLQAGGEHEVLPWHIYSGSLPQDDAPLSLGYCSHVLQVFAPYHQNEADNLRSKLLDACANLARHGVSEDALSANLVYVHIPPAASVDDCESWVKEWFIEFPSKPVSAVVLYQPSVARTPENDSLIHHCVRVVTRATGPLLPGNPSAIPGVEVAVGRPGREPAAQQVRAPDGRAVVLLGHYIYQRGDIYREMPMTADGQWTGNLSTPAPGIHIHAVLPRHLSGGSVVAFQGRMPETDELLLL